jgi:hypothetical protein
MCGGKLISKRHKHDRSKFAKHLFQLTPGACSLPSFFFRQKGSIGQTAHAAPASSLLEQKEKQMCDLEGSDWLLRLELS